MPKAFLLTSKRYDLYKLNIPKIYQEVSEDAKVVNTKEIYPETDQREWTLVIQEEDEEEEEPVNLSLKKLDLFNLTQLAEVSLARAKTDEEIHHQSPTISSSASSSPEGSLIEEDGGGGINQNRTNQSKSSNQRHLCNECGRGFSTLSNLARHRQTHRSPTDASVVKKCPNCDKVYVSMPAFSMHLRTHNQGCKCPFCGKGFSRPWLLQGHIRTHTGEKPFKCEVCSKAFADKSNLRAHVQTHSSDKPFSCSRCQKTFALKSYLCKHIESSCMRSSRITHSNHNNNNSSSDDI